MASDVTYRRKGDVTSDKVVSSVRVTVAGGHALIIVWNRGGNAGSLTVDRDDAQWFVDALIPPSVQLVPTPAPEGTDGK